MDNYRLFEFQPRAKRSNGLAIELPRSEYCLAVLNIGNLSYTPGSTQEKTAFFDKRDPEQNGSVRVKISTY